MFASSPGVYYLLFLHIAYLLFKAWKLSASLPICSPHWLPWAGRSFSIGLFPAFGFKPITYPAALLFKFLLYPYWYREMSLVPLRRLDMETEMILSSFYKKRAYLFLYMINLAWSSGLFQLSSRYISVWLKKKKMFWALLFVCAGLGGDIGKAMRKHWCCDWRALGHVEKQWCVGKH